MSIDLFSEPLLRFDEAAKLLPRQSRPSYTTWWRWSRRGIRGVRLDTVLCGGRRMTSAAALARFLAAVTAAGEGAQAPLSTPSRNRSTTSMAAARELDAEGL